MNLRPGKSGDWELSQFIVSENDAKWSQVRCAINGYGSRAVSAGTYWKLTLRGSIYMSNTPAEVLDHMMFIHKAKGKVLIAGLGLGMVLQALLDKGSCVKIVVVEKSEDVIKLVGPSYNYPNVEIVHADIFDYKPTEYFDYAWFDIWPDICADNYEDMKKLYRKFSRSVIFKDCWMRDTCKRLYKLNR